jgi:NitT/TauT family transport system ATP-binding protein
VFSARPGTIIKVIAVNEPHPRRPDFVTSPKFTALRNELFGLLHDEIRKAVLQSSAVETAGQALSPPSAASTGR